MNYFYKYDSFIVCDVWNTRDRFNGYVLSETKLKGIILNNVQVGLFTFGVKYE